MARPQGYVTLSVHVRQDVADRLKKEFPKYGETSMVLRKLIALLLSGHIELKKKIGG
jgi:hypothetical protein